MEQILNKFWTYQVISIGYNATNLTKNIYKCGCLWETLLFKRKVADGNLHVLISRVTVWAVRYQWLAVWPVPVITGGTWPAPSRCRTHALLAAPRPPKNWQSRRLPACLSLTTVHISMRDYLFRPCTPHNGMWHKWFVVYNNRTQRSGYDVLYSLLNSTILHAEAVIIIIRSLNRQSIESCIFISYLKNSFLWRNKLKGLC